MNKKKALWLISCVVFSFIFSACSGGTEPTSCTNRSCEPNRRDCRRKPKNLKIRRRQRVKELMLSCRYACGLYQFERMNLLVPALRPITSRQANYWPTLYGIGDQISTWFPSSADFASPFVEVDGLFVSTITLKDGYKWSDGRKLRQMTWPLQPGCD